MKTFKIALAILLAGILPSNTFAGSGAGTSGGLTLLAPYSARSSALGGALTATTNDIAGFAMNPASLSTLQTGQASFLYQQGLFDDAYGNFAIGSPRGRTSGVGLGVGYYNGGSIELTEESGEQRTVNAQTDLTLSLGLARRVGGVTLGVTGKYLRSELIESARAQAFALDAGVQVPVSARTRMGFAIQNYGTELKYLQEGDPLPRIARAGVSYLLFPGQYSTSLMLDLPYMVNEKEFVPATGIEVMVGPLALRGGYRGGKAKEFTIGTGFAMGATSVDYSFGLIQELDAEHKISLAMKFGGERRSLVDFVKKEPTRAPAKVVAQSKKPATAKTAAVNKSSTVKKSSSASSSKSSSDKNRVAWQVNQKNSNGGSTPEKVKANAPRTGRRVYIVQPGDSLASIAKKEYGLASQWKAIYSANKHLIDDPTDIEKGQKIVLP